MDSFSFIQEEDAKINFSYSSLIQQMSTETQKAQRETRVLNEVKPESPIIVSPVPKSATKSGFASDRMNNNDFKKSMIRQICIWTPIILFIALYFIVISIIDMPIQKNSILYAKYGTTKPAQLAQQ